MFDRETERARLMATRYVVRFTTGPCLVHVSVGCPHHRTRSYVDTHEMGFAER
jgi:hypothetical protein